MNSIALKSILVDELDAKAEGDAVELPSDTKVTVLVRYGDDLVPVAKLRSVRFTDGFVNLVGEKEQVFVDVDCDFLVKSEVGHNKHKDGRPGFHS